MIVGIGVDLVEVDRIERLLRKFAERARARLFTGAEVAYCVASRCPAESFAARFAAKEAVLKALGTGWTQGVSWTEIEVVREDGAPRLSLHGACAQVAAERGVKHTHLTLTHTASTACAFVVLEG